MKNHEPITPCSKNANSSRPSLAKWALLTLTHSIFMALTLALLAPLALPAADFIQSARYALVAGAAFACGFRAIDYLLSSLLEKPVLCILTYNEPADRTGIIVFVFACFAIGYITVATLGLALGNVLSILALRSAFDFVATTALLITVQSMLVIYRYATTHTRH